jgi:hypothetical protein
LIYYENALNATEAALRQKHPNLENKVIYNIEEDRKSPPVDDSYPLNEERRNQILTKKISSCYGIGVVIEQEFQSFHGMIYRFYFKKKELLDIIKQ